MPHSEENEDQLSLLDLETSPAAPSTPKSEHRSSVVDGANSPTGEDNDPTREDPTQTSRPSRESRDPLATGDAPGDNAPVTPQTNNVGQRGPTTLYLKEGAIEISDQLRSDRTPNSEDEAPNGA